MDIEKAKICKLINNDYARENVLNHNFDDFCGKDYVFLKISNTVYPSKGVDSIERGKIGASSFVRNFHGFALEDPISLKVHYPIRGTIAEMSVKLIRYGIESEEIVSFHEDDIKEGFLQAFSKKYYIYTNQCLFFSFKSAKFLACIVSKSVGFCDEKTQINFISDDVSLNIVGSKFMKKDIFRDDYDFEQLGIGGLDKQLIDILRRCLTTRAYRKETIEKLGISHVKGMLLYGAPGCGKTLIARKIGSIISNKEPKVINGPEILNKYVGESEKNIRELFSDAISDKSEELHVIIFDEIDALCKKRGGKGSVGHVSDNIVNQLLTMIDGYKEKNNIFIIGMTNRKDLLDEALLRAGRLEVHIEIGLPDKKGREQIFRVHTKNMYVNNMLQDFDVDLFSTMTENYTGAEIEAVVKNAATRALHENLIDKMKDEKLKDDNEKRDSVTITKEHFIKAIDEISPMFGRNVRDIKTMIPKILDGRNEFREKQNFIIQKITETEERVASFLLKGEKRLGKTTLAVSSALETGIKNLKVIRAMDMVSMCEIEKVNYITEIIKNSYMSDRSIIVLDDIEILMNYATIGNGVTFSNRLYQVLVTILKNPPQNINHKIFFICTCTENISSVERMFDYVL